MALVEVSRHADGTRSNNLMRRADGPCAALSPVSGAASPDATAAAAAARTSPAGPAPPGPRCRSCEPAPPSPVAAGPEPPFGPALQRSSRSGVMPASGPQSPTSRQPQPASPCMQESLLRRQPQPGAGGPGAGPGSGGAGGGSPTGGGGGASARGSDAASVFGLGISGLEQALQRMHAPGGAFDEAAKLEGLQRPACRHGACHTHAGGGDAGCGAGSAAGDEWDEFSTAGRRRAAKAAAAAAAAQVAAAEAAAAAHGRMLALAEIVCRAANGELFCLELG